MKFIRILAMLVLCIVSPLLSAQSKMGTYTSPDRRFQFKHSEVLVPCTEPDRDEGKRGGWYPDSCRGYIPVCDDRGIAESNTLVCFAYPKAKFEGYPTFEAATFSVAVIETARTERQCFSELLDDAIDKPRAPKVERINGVRFRVFQIGTGAMNQDVDGREYRSYHRGSCYQLSIRTETASAAVFDPGVKELSKTDWVEVNGRLEECLRSFRFLK